MVTAEASFASIPTSGQAMYDAAIELQAIEVLPTTPSQFFFPAPHSGSRLPEDGANPSDEAHPYFKPATTQRQIPLPPSGTPWKRVRAEIRVPAGTRYIVVGLHVVDRMAANQKPELRDVSFPGQFTDDIQVRLIRKVPLP
jgi:hypothetical protein